VQPFDVNSVMVADIITVVAVMIPANSRRRNRSTSFEARAALERLMMLMRNMLMMKLLMTKMMLIIIIIIIITTTAMGLVMMQLVQVAVLRRRVLVEPIRHEQRVSDKLEKGVEGNYVRVLGVQQSAHQLEVVRPQARQALGSSQEFLPPCVDG
jgi:hypothetical protein